VADKAATSLPHAPPAFCEGTGMNALELAKNIGFGVAIMLACMLAVALGSYALTFLFR
jgi:hypothetical protein